MFYQPFKNAFLSRNLDLKCVFLEKSCKICTLLCLFFTVIFAVLVGMLGSQKYFCPRPQWTLAICHWLH